MSVDPRTASPPCPYAAAGSPPPTYYGPPQLYVSPVYRAQPLERPAKPRYAPDPARKGALIASSLVFGLGTVAAGTAYLTSVASHEFGARSEPSTPALWAMGAFLTLPPSVPRFVVGQVGWGLALTALRGGSFAMGTLIDWEDDSRVLPVTLAFVVPLTLGIVDLATTPHREQVNPPKDETASFTLRGVAPTVAVDHTGAPMPAVTAVGTFF